MSGQVNHLSTIWPFKLMQELPPALASKVFSITKLKFVKVPFLRIN